MANYKVLSDMIAGCEPGDTIDDNDLEGCNIAALVESGHLAEAKSTKADKE